MGRKKNETAHRKERIEPFCPACRKLLRPLGYRNGVVVIGCGCKRETPRLTHCFCRTDPAKALPLDENGRCPKADSLGESLVAKWNA